MKPDQTKWVRCNAFGPNGHTCWKPKGHGDRHEARLASGVFQWCNLGPSQKE